METYMTSRNQCAGLVIAEPARLLSLEEWKALLQERLPSLKRPRLEEGATENEEADEEVEDDERSEEESTGEDELTDDDEAAPEPGTNKRKRKLEWVALTSQRYPDVDKGREYSFIMDDILYDDGEEDEGHPYIRAGILARESGRMRGRFQRFCGWLVKRFQDTVEFSQMCDKFGRLERRYYNSAGAFAGDVFREELGEGDVLVVERFRVPKGLR
ncbi:hypothetical protein HDV00_009903, partial [Rhizophlyctis rosea]